MVHRKLDRQGFTLIAILVVVDIIAGLIVILFPRGHAKRHSRDDYQPNWKGNVFDMETQL